MQNVGASQDSPDSPHTYSMSFDGPFGDKSIPGPFSNQGPLSDGLKIARHLSSSMASIKDITENSDNPDPSIKEGEVKEIKSKDSIHTEEEPAVGITDIQIFDPIKGYSSRNKGELSNDKESTETVMTHNLKIQEEA